MIQKPRCPIVDTVATVSDRIVDLRCEANLPSTTSLLRAVQDERLAVEVLGQFDASSTRMRADLNARPRLRRPGAEHGRYAAASKRLGSCEL